MATTLPNLPTKKDYLGPSRDAAKKSARYTRRKRRRTLAEIAGGKR